MMGIAQMQWKLGMTRVDIKRLSDLTAEVGLASTLTVYLTGSICRNTHIAYR
jgi:hypothetical protein